MEITLRQRLEQFSHLNQTRLFDFLEQQAGSLTDKTRLLVSALGMLPLSRLIAPTRGWKGRRSKDRQSLASAAGTRSKRCRTNPLFRAPTPEFAGSELSQHLHEAVIQDAHKKNTPESPLVGHITRDSTAIEARERDPETTEQAGARQEKHPRQKLARVNKQRAPQHLKAKPVPKRKRGRSKKSERALSGKRLPRQRRQTQYWHGYKLHIDVAYGQVPISCVLTSASLHDSQAAIPLATITNQRSCCALVNGGVLLGTVFGSLRRLS